MRNNTTKAKVLEFVAANPGLKRKAYIAAFLELGMTDNSASLYHYLYVTKVAKETKKIVVKGPVRDPKTGRYMKKVA